MKEPLFMNVNQGLDQLLRDESNLMLFQLLAPLLPLSHQLVEILLDVLEDEVSLIDHSDHLFQFYYVRVVHLPESLHFQQLQALLPSAVLLL